MTGEITLRGDVLPVGGLKEKLLAARAAGVREVVMPKLNRRDLADVPEVAKRGVDLRYAETVDDALERLLRPVKSRTGKPAGPERRRPARSGR